MFDLRVLWYGFLLAVGILGAVVLVSVLVGVFIRWIDDWAWRHR